MASPDDTSSSRPAGIYGPVFQERRLEALERDKHRCVCCNHDGSDYRLEVHHRTYDNGTDPKLEDLYTLCVQCHDLITDKMRRERNVAARVQVIEIKNTVTVGRPVIVTASSIDVIEENSPVQGRPSFVAKCDIDIPDCNTTRSMK